MTRIVAAAALFLCSLPAFAQDDLQRKIEAREKDLEYMAGLIEKAERSNDTKEADRLRRDYNDTVRALEKLRHQAGESPREHRVYSSRGFIPADLVFDMRFFRLPSAWRLATPVNLDLDAMGNTKSPELGPAVDIGFGISLEFEPSPFFISYHGFRSVDRETKDNVYVQQLLFGVKALDIPLADKRQTEPMSFQLLASAGFTDFYAPGVGPDAKPGLTLSIEPRFVMHLSERAELILTLMEFEVVWTDFNQTGIHASMGSWMIGLGVGFKY